MPEGDLLVVFLDLAAKIIEIILGYDALAAKRGDEPLLVIVVDGREEISGDSALIIGAVYERDDGICALALFEGDIALELETGDQGEDGRECEMTNLLRESCLELACLNVLDALCLKVPDALHYGELGSGKFAEIGIF